MIVIVMNKSTPGHFGRATKSLLAGSVIMGAALLPSSTQAQGTIETYNFSGVVNGLFGNGNGVAVGATVSGTINYNSGDFVAMSGNNSGIAGYNNTSANIVVDINGNVSTSQGMDAWEYVNSQDFGSPSVSCDSLLIAWGPGDSDYVSICSSLGTIANVSASGITSGQWWANRIPNPLDLGFAANFDASGNGVGGVLSSLSLDPTPEPSTLALGVLGGLGLLAKRYSFRRPKQQPALAMK
jgi:hypothetical protein